MGNSPESSSVYRGFDQTSKQWFLEFRDPQGKVLDRYFETTREEFSQRMKNIVDELRHQNEEQANMPLGEVLYKLVDSSGGKPGELNKFTDELYGLLNLANVAWSEGARYFRSRSGHMWTMNNAAFVHLPMSENGSVRQLLRIGPKGSVAKEYNEVAYDEFCRTLESFKEDIIAGALALKAKESELYSSGALDELGPELWDKVPDGLPFSGLLNAASLARGLNEAYRSYDGQLEDVEEYLDLLEDVTMSINTYVEAVNRSVGCDALFFTSPQGPPLVVSEEGYENMREGKLPGWEAPSPEKKSDSMYL